MRKYLWVIVAALSVAICSSTAHAGSIQYTATFTCSGTCVSLPSAPAVAFPSPTTIMETWDGFVFSIPLLASEAPTDTFQWSNSFVLDPLCTPSCGPAFATLLDQTTPTLTNALLTNVNGTPAFDRGTLTFAPVATPEPSSVTLMLAVIGVLMAKRKRLAQGLE